MIVQKKPSLLYTNMPKKYILLAFSKNQSNLYITLLFTNKTLLAMPILFILKEISPKLFAVVLIISINSISLKLELSNINNIFTIISIQKCFDSNKKIFQNKTRNLQNESVDVQYLADIKLIYFTLASTFFFISS